MYMCFCTFICLSMCLYLIYMSVGVGVWVCTYVYVCMCMFARVHEIYLIIACDCVYVCLGGYILADIHLPLHVHGSTGCMCGRGHM